MVEKPHMCIQMWYQEAMLHGLFYFHHVPMSDGYDMGVGLGYVSDTHTQFKHSDPPKFDIFKKKKSHYLENKYF